MAIIYQRYLSTSRCTSMNTSCILNGLINVMKKTNEMHRNENMGARIMQNLYRESTISRSLNNSLTLFVPLLCGY